MVFSDSDASESSYYSEDYSSYYDSDDDSYYDSSSEVRQCCRFTNCKIYVDLVLLWSEIHVVLNKNLDSDKTESSYYSDVYSSYYEPCHEKTRLCHMQTTKAQVSLRMRTV